MGGFTAFAVNAVKRAGLVGHKVYAQGNPEPSGNNRAEQIFINSPAAMQNSQSTLLNDFSRIFTGQLRHRGLP